MEGGEGSFGISFKADQQGDETAPGNSARRILASRAESLSIAYAEVFFSGAMLKKQDEILIFAANPSHVVHWEEPRWGPGNGVGVNRNQNELTLIYTCTDVDNRHSWRNGVWKDHRCA